MTDAFDALGMRSDLLTPSERLSLDQKGFMIVPKALSESQAAAMAARLDDLAAAEGEAAGRDFHTEKGATRLGSLVNKDPMFDICFLHPHALAAVDYVMKGDFGLSSITGRAAQPGEGLQALHRDSSLPCANVLWAISAFTPENGPTRLVPGSHLHPKSPSEAIENPEARHSDEIYLVVPAGTLVVINGWTWHGGTRNTTTRARHLVSAFFTPRGKYQSIAHRQLTSDSQQRFSEAARFIIDHEPAH